MFNNKPVVCNRFIKISATNHIHIKDIINVKREIIIGKFGGSFFGVKINMRIVKMRQMQKEREMM